MTTNKLLLVLLIILNSISSIWGQLPNYVPNIGLLGWYPFNGNANDQSDNGYLGSGNAVLTHDRFGVPNAAYSFNGIDQYISTNFPGVPGKQARTISLWAKTTSQNNILLLSYGPNNPAGARFDVLYNYGSPGITAGTSHAAVTYRAENISDNRWHHIVFRLKDLPNPRITNVEVFLDGQLLSTFVHTFHSSTTLNSLPNAMGIGDHANGETPFKFFGCLDDIGIWNRALTDEEILGLYEYKGPNLCIAIVDEIGREISVFPNPVRDKLTIRNYIPDSSLGIVVFNVLGQRVHSTTLSTEQIDISNWANGVYFFQIVGQCGKYIQKIIKQ